MPIGTAFHSRTSALCESMAWRDWAGYFAVSTYEVHHDREYNAIRNAAALIDISPLFKYRRGGQGRGAPRGPRGHPRRARRWRWARWPTPTGATARARSSTTAPCRAWRETPSAGPRPSPPCAGSARTRHGLEVDGRRTSRTRRPPLALQGPTSRAILDGLRRGRRGRPSSTSGSCPRRSRGIPVEISRTGYTGDLGYEIWVARRAGRDALGRAHGGGTSLRHHAHRACYALDVARIEAGLDHARRRLQLVAQGPHPLAAVHALRDRHGPPRPPRQGALHRPGRPAPRSRSRARRGSSWASTSTGPTSSGSTTRRGSRPRSPATASRVVGARLPGRHAGGQGHEHDLVAHPEEDDRPRHGGVRARPRSARASRCEFTVDHKRKAVPGRPWPSCRSSIPPRKRA